MKEYTTGVEISITQGDLIHAQYPVMLGHFKYDGIVSAERVLDRYLNGRLAERHALGVYPGEIEESLYLANASLFPRGGIVVGLGDFGELSVGDLSRSVTAAVINYLMSANDTRHENEDPLDLRTGVSSLLIGSGYGGLTIMAGMRAILLGVQMANERIKVHNLEGVDIIESVEFIEIYEHRAIQAARTIAQLLESGSFDEFSWRSRKIRKVPGGLRNIPDDVKTDWWHRIKVDLVDRKDVFYEPLRFTSLTDRARAEETDIHTNRQLVDKLVRKAAKHARWERGVAKALFELLVPNAFKEYAIDRKNILWIVNEKTAAYPWEILYDADHDRSEPLSVKAGMLRQLAVTRFRQQTNPNIENRALVIGNPDLEGKYADLPKAAEEAMLVTRKLSEHGFEPKELIRKNALDIISELFGQGYQIIHLAGHGVVNHKELGGTGMVIGKDTLLTSGELNQLSSDIPELVFVNCCFLGKTKQPPEETIADRHAFAANIGTQLIEMGVRAVVAAGWAVKEAPAKKFAESFYRHMLGGWAFGEAVRQARYDAYLEDNTSNTWGAYQCYGDPYFTLTRRSGAPQGNARIFVDDVEAEMELENMINRAGSAAERDGQRLKASLEALTDKIREYGFLERPRIVEKLAQAYAEIEMYPEAIAYYGKLLKMDKPYFSLKAIEAYSNLRARYGAEKQDWGDSSGAAYIHEAISDLNKLIRLSGTSSSYSTLGSAYKRLASVSEEFTKCTKALKDSANAYFESCRIVFKNRHVNHYPVFNWLSMEAILVLFGKKTEDQMESLIRKEGFASLEKLIAMAEKDAHNFDRTNPSFWGLAAPASVKLGHILTNKGQHEALAEAYIGQFRKAWRRGGSFHHRNSVLDNLKVLIRILENGRLAKKSLRPGIARTHTTISNIKTVLEKDIFI